MKNFATLLSEYITAKEKFNHYDELLKKCKETFLVKPKDKKEYYQISTYWEALREDFPESYVLDDPYYPRLLRHYMYDDIDVEAIQKEMDNSLKKLEKYQKFLERKYNNSKEEMEKAFKMFSIINSQNKCLAKVLEFVKEHSDAIETMLEAEFDEIG